MEEVDHLCAICLEVSSEEATKALTCSHSFHKKCVDIWLSQRNTCPLCRTSQAGSCRRAKTLSSIITFGQPDVYLTGSPQLTFWRVVMQRHSNRQL